MARVLIIEDNAMNLELARVLLEFAGHEVFGAEDGETGINLAEQVAPDVVLLDIQLPEMDGYAVLKKLQQSEATKFLPVVAVSSYAMVGDREKALDAGFAGYISKPIEPTTFVQQILEIAGFENKKTGRGAA